MPIITFAKENSTNLKTKIREAMEGMTAPEYLTFKFYKDSHNITLRLGWANNFEHDIEAISTSVPTRSVTLTAHRIRVDMLRKALDLKGDKFEMLLYYHKESKRWRLSMSDGNIPNDIVVSVNYKAAEYE